MKVLNIIESAFRTLVEEQDDTIIWLTQTLKKAGGDIQILLSGNACQYAFIRNPLPNLKLGEWEQKSPANIGADIQRILELGIPVYAYEEDVRQRGLNPADITQGVNLVSRNQAGKLYSEADQVWHW